MIRITGEKEPLFILETAHTTYAMKVMPTRHVEHLYYGRKIHLDDADGLSEHFEFPVGNSSTYSSPAAAPDGEDGAGSGETGSAAGTDTAGAASAATAGKASTAGSKFTLEDVRLEMSSYGKGDIREAFVEAVFADGSSTIDLLYDSYAQGEGRGEEAAADEDLQELPFSYGKDAKVLTLTLKDINTNLQLDLIYTVYEECDVITRRAVITNGGEADVRLQKLMSTQLDLDPGDYTFTTFTGAWAREMKKTNMPVLNARLVASSFTGSSSNRANPFVMISRGTCLEDYGECWGINLVYSGNHMSSIEKNAYGKPRFLQGINPTGFEWKLSKGESFASPESVMTYSHLGYNGMSGQMHDFVSKHILRGPWKDRLRPVLLNSWEAAYFKISERKLLRLARKAKKAGIELFVMDDGWFGKRDDDTSSLGDWYPDKKKLPHGIKGLCDRIRKLGLEFGIWVEPEMISRDSDLYRAHPDWAMAIPGRPHSEGRNQMVLDLTRKDVQDHVIASMSEVFSSADISYVKWDYNRNFTDIFSTALPADRQGEVCHRYILGLYRVMRVLTRKFPEILFEGCASGGNRFDLGILSYFPQIWASDDTDAVCRTEIQNGYSYAYPMSTVTAHVSDVPNHQTLRRTPLETRFNVASFGVLGYECNFCDMSSEEFKAVAAQIALYKEWREVMQKGRFYRGGMKPDQSALEGSPDSGIMWTVVSPDRTKAVTMTMQYLVKPNWKWHVLRPSGLEESYKYRIRGRDLKFDLREFGGLVNYVAPFHVKQGGFVHALISRFVKMDSEKEEHIMYGDAMMYAGVHLTGAFASAGYNDKVRHYPDFASRIYTVEKAG